MVLNSTTLSFIVVKSSLAKMLASDGEKKVGSDEIESGVEEIRTPYLLTALLLVRAHE